MNPRMLRAATWAICLAPLMWLASLIWQELQLPGSSLGADPGESVVRYLGEWSIRLLLLTLTLSSVARLTGARSLIRVRRLVGLFAFTYVCLHLTSYAGLLAGFDLDRLSEDLVGRPYILVGFTALLTLVPLAVTSTRGWRRQLGPSWTKLHRLIYPAAALAVLHLVWLSKSSYAEASFYGVWFVLLMLERIPRRAATVGESPI